MNIRLETDQAEIEPLVLCSITLDEFAHLGRGEPPSAIAQGVHSRGSDAPVGTEEAVRFATVQIGLSRRWLGHMGAFHSHAQLCDSCARHLRNPASASSYESKALDRRATSARKY